MRTAFFNKFSVICKAKFLCIATTQTSILIPSDFLPIVIAGVLSFHPPLPFEQHLNQRHFTKAFKNFSPDVPSSNTLVSCEYRTIAFYFVCSEEIENQRKSYCGEERVKLRRCGFLFDNEKQAIRLRF